MNCNHCGSDRVRAETAMVRGSSCRNGVLGGEHVHGKRIIFVCESCGLSWISTEPNVVEQLVAATTPIGKRWE